mgnify:CR=1
TSTAGDLTIKADASTAKFTVTAASGNTDIQGTLAVASTTAFAGDVTSTAGDLTIKADASTPKFTVTAAS